MYTANYWHVIKVIYIDVILFIVGELVPGAIVERKTPSINKLKKQRSSKILKYYSAKYKFVCKIVLNIL